jgi:hypothetical protein
MNETLFRDNNSLGTHIVFAKRTKFKKNHMSYFPLRASAVTTKTIFPDAEGVGAFLTRFDETRRNVAQFCEFLRRIKLKTCKLDLGLLNH